MDLGQSIILGIIQGITEFLPVSSSGHLILFPKLFGWSDQGLAFDAVVHLGTALAAIIYFREDIKKFFRNGKMVWVLLLSMIPAAFVGLMFKDVISSSARTLPVIATSLLVWGIVLILAELFAQKQKKQTDLNQITYKKAIFIGLAQAIALIPGTSRSGITISAGLFSKMNRETAVKFSFLISIPIILGAGFLNLVDLVQSSGEAISWAALTGSLIASFLSGMFAIHLLLKFVAHKGLIYFGVYRILLALVLMSIAF